MKNVLIFGDSYSTFEGYIPDGYAFYYCKQGREQGPAVTKMNVEETWWKRVLAATGDNLLLNNSWSGSTIGYTGYNDTDCSTSSSFIYRYRQLKAQGFFEKNRVDRLFIFGGTNDSWSGAPLGEMQFDNWTEKDLYCALPALCYFINEVKTELPNAEIIVIINTEIREEIQDGLESAAKRYGVNYIRLKNIDKDFGHPSVKGMQSISEQVLGVLA